MPLWGQLELLCRAIAAEGQKEAEKILTQSRTEAERLRSEAQENAEVKFQGEILSQRTKAYAEAKRRVDAAELEAKRRIMAFREEIIQEVFQALEDRLNKFRQEPSYPDFLLNVLQEGIERLPGQDFVVELPEADEQIMAEGIRALAKELSLTISIKRSTELTDGVRVYTRDQRQLYDNTLAARVKRLENEIRQEIWKGIFGA